MEVSFPPGEGSLRSLRGRDPSVPSGEVHSPRDPRGISARDQRVQKSQPPYPNVVIPCISPRLQSQLVSKLDTSVLNGSGRPSLAPGRPRPDPEGQVKYKLGQYGPAVGQAGGRERWQFFQPPLTWANLGPALDPELRKRVVNLQKITLKSFILWGRVKFCIEL